MEEVGAAEAKADADSEASMSSRLYAPPDSPGEPKQPRDWRFGLTGGGPWSVARFLVAVAVSAVLCLLIGRFAAPSLAGPTDIVGYPTFANYNFERSFWIYRLTVYAFPLFAIVGYVLLARFGPLRSLSPRPAKRTIELVEPAPTGPPTPERASWSSFARVLLPAVVVVAACSARTGHMDLLAVAAGVVYMALVVAVAEVWARRADGQRWRALSAVNGVGGAVAAVLSLWFVSAHTVVQTATGTRSWPWLVWWLPVLGVVAIGWWSVRQLRGGRAAGDVELTLLTVVVGAIALFLTISILPGQITHFQGYDDAAQETVAASLLARGYFPWRDLLFTHGLFPEVLTGSLGRAIFGDSIWGEYAIHSMILIPLFWVSTYLFAVWVSRRNQWFLTLTFLYAASFVRPLVEFERFPGLPTLLSVSDRFIGLPVTLIVLGETLRRRSIAWVVGLALLLFVEEILVPETLFLAGPALACVVAADLVHRRPEQRLWTSLRLTRWGIATGLVATAVWAAFLAAFGTLRSFIDYYVVFGPGHNLAGATPPRDMTFNEWTMLAIAIVCVLLTVWAVAIKVARRADWEARDWVAVAAAAFMALYLEKPLGCFDMPHVWQAFLAGLPLVLSVSWRLFDGLGQLIVAWWRGRRAPLVRFVYPVTAVLIPVIVLGCVYKADRYHLAGVTEASFGRVGYAAPRAIDTGLLRDLDTAIRAYAGDYGPVFDMSNSNGYVYFLLGRMPGTRFTYVSMAISEYAQRLLIDELKTSRPPVVVYDVTSIGFPTWYDGITSDVRHYELSEYVLHGWTPVLRTHGVLVMARNDLVSSRPVPVLATPPQTTDLYFSGPSCAWGATPNYLPVPDGGQAMKLPVRSPIPRMVVYYSGWAVDPATNRPASTVLIADGDRVVGTATPSIDRPDVAENLRQPMSVSGFRFDAVFDAAVHPSAYLVGADGLAHPLGGSPAVSVAALRMPDGSQVRVAPTVGGNLEVHNADVRTVGEIQLPSGINLRDYDLAILSSTGGLGGAKVALTDQPGRPLHEISASWLDQTGPRLTLRVGSCPQWYGYDPSKPLYVVQGGGPPVNSVSLSAMR
jgi:hypothetical protein